MTGTEYKTAPALEHRDGQRWETARFRRRTHSPTHFNESGPKSQVLPEHYEAVKAAVSVADAARLYGLDVDRHGKAHCIFHNDRHPSMWLYPGRYKCFACGETGTVIDLVARLLGLSTADAVRRLNADFGINLPLDRQATAEERAEATRRRERREFVKDAEARFNAWRNATLRMLTLCLEIADDAEGVPPADLSAEELLALRYAPPLENWWDMLNDERDTPERIEQQMALLRRREEVERACQLILTAWRMRLSSYSR